MHPALAEPGRAGRPCSTRPGPAPWVIAASLAAGLLLAGGEPVRGQHPDALAVLERASARYRAAASLCADFTQRLEVPLLSSDRTGAGRLCWARPNRFAMRFSDPAGDLVVADGDWIWLHYPSLDDKQVLRIRLTESSTGYDLHRTFLEHAAGKHEIAYEATENLGGRATHRLRLVPLRPASYVAAVLWIDAASPPALRRVRVEEEGGTVRTVTLSRIEVEPAGLDDAWFGFKPPPGAQVIEAAPNVAKGVPGGKQSW